MKNLIILFTVKLGFSKLNPSDKANKALNVVNHLTGNTDFPTPVPALSVITTQAQDVLTKQQQLDGSKIKTEQRNIAVKTLSSSMNQLQGYVDTTANGNVEKILSAGFEPINKRTPSAKVGPVTGLTVTPTANEGEASIKWNPIKKSNLNVVFVSYDLKQWDIKGESTKSKLLLKDLNSGVTAYFRVVCVNAAGPGDPSDIAACKIL